MFFMYTCYINELWTIDVHFPNSHIMAMVHYFKQFSLEQVHKCQNSSISITSVEHKYTVSMLKIVIF